MCPAGVLSAAAEAVWACTVWCMLSAGVACWCNHCDAVCMRVPGCGRAHPRVNSHSGALALWVCLQWRLQVRPGRLSVILGHALRGPHCCGAVPRLRGGVCPQLPRGSTSGTARPSTSPPPPATRAPVQWWILLALACAWACSPSLSDIRPRKVLGLSALQRQGPLAAPEGRPTRHLCSGQSTVVLRPDSPKHTLQKLQAGRRLRRPSWWRELSGEPWSRESTRRPEGPVGPGCGRRARPQAQPSSSPVGPQPTAAASPGRVHHVTLPCRP